MAKKFDMIEAVVIVICLLFAVAISFYHIAQDGEFGLSTKQWRAVWAVSENGLSLTMSVVIVIFSYGLIRTIFKYLFIPYFTIKLIYHFSCFAGIYILPAETWSYVWSGVCVLSIIFGLYLLLKKRQ